MKVNVVSVAIFSGLASIFYFIASLGASNDANTLKNIAWASAEIGSTNFYYGTKGFAQQDGDSGDLHYTSYEDSSTLKGSCGGDNSQTVIVLQGFAVFVSLATSFLSLLTMFSSNHSTNFMKNLLFCCALVSAVFGMTSFIVFVDQCYNGPHGIQDFQNDANADKAAMGPGGILALFGWLISWLIICLHYFASTGKMDIIEAVNVFMSSSIPLLYSALLMLAFGAFSAHQFLLVDFFTDSSQCGLLPDPSCYSVSGWVALVVATYLLPLGVCVLLIWTVQSTKEPPSLLTFVHQFIMWALSIVCMAKGHDLAAEIMSCGVLFCSAADTDLPENENNAAEQAYGWYFFWGGLLYNLVCDFILIKAISQYFREKTSTDVYEEGTENETPLIRPSLMYSLLKERTSSILRKRDANSNSYVFFDTILPLALVFGALYPFYWFCCMALPTWWYKFTVSELQSYMAQDPEANSGNTGQVWKVYVNSTFVLKLFPDILMYYMGIYCVVFVALAAKFFPSVRRFLHGRPDMLKSLSVGEALLVAFLVLQLIGQFCYWYLDKIYELGYLYGDGTQGNNGMPNEERLARALGQVANVACGLLILPISRNNIWSILFGVSWDSMVKWHTYIGGTFLLMVMCHMFSWWRAFATDTINTFPHDIFSVPQDFHPDNWTVPLAIFTSFLMFPIMGIGAYWWVRRNYHEYFYWLHHFSLPIFFMMTWHATMSWYFMSAGLVLYAIDHFIRIYNCVGTDVQLEDVSVTKVKEKGKGDRVTKLTYTVRRFNVFSKTSYRPIDHKAGQFAFICVPEISMFEWHPFTISSSACDNFTTHHIKTMGPGTWTEKLADLVASYKAGECMPPTVQVDGPYGHAVDVGNYKSICLVCGGIGITPMISLLKDVVNYASTFPDLVELKLLWSSRSFEELMIFDGVLSDVFTMEPNNLKVIVSLYLTQKVDDPLGTKIGSFDVKYSRIDFETEFESLKKYGMDALVYACGPEAIVSNCSQWSMNHKVDFKYETFEL